MRSIKTVVKNNCLILKGNQWNGLRTYVNLNSDPTSIKSICGLCDEDIHLTRKLKMVHFNNQYLVLHVDVTINGNKERFRAPKWAYRGPIQY